jgi:uncharacterized membrane protein YfcA
MISLFQLDWPQILAVVSIMLFAGLVHGTLGLGFPMVATPLLAIFFDVRAAILITLLPSVAVYSASIWHSASSFDSVRRFLPLPVFGLIGSVAGTYVLVNTDPAPFRIALAGLILLYLSSNYFGRLPRRWLDANAMAAMLVFGLLAGFSAGTTNVMVAVLIVYFLSLGVSRTAMVPALNACFLSGKVAQIVVFAVAGFLDFALLFATLPLAVAAVAALLFGQRIRESIAVDTYRRVLHLLLVLLAGVLIMQFLLETI